MLLGYTLLKFTFKNVLSKIDRLKNTATTIPCIYLSNIDDGWCNIQQNFPKSNNLFDIKGQLWADWLSKYLTAVLALKAETANMEAIVVNGGESFQPLLKHIGSSELIQILFVVLI